MPGVIKVFLIRGMFDLAGPGRQGGFVQIHEHGVEFISYGTGEAYHQT